jgi:exosortase A
VNAILENKNRCWRSALPPLFIAMAFLGFAYRETFASMSDIWWRSETYTHGLLVPLISVWLIWRSRHRISGVTPSTWLWPLLPLGLSVFAWLLGELATVNALTQFSVVAMLVFCCMSLLGLNVSRKLAFPILFLFFAVPIGDFLLPKLMEWTADFTVVALRLSGIPVYREGQNFVIPSGNWSVVEACSGIRYLIASLTIGTLYAYLTYTSIKRRLIFVAVSLMVPIIANWLRAYMIVMLGHLSGNKLAVGVDHLIYGWIFFGVVIAIMFSIGMRWTEPEAVEGPSSTTNEASDAELPTGKRWLLAGVVAFVLAVGPIAKERIQGANNSHSPALDAPQAIGPWQRAPRFVDIRPSFKDPSTELHEAYQYDDQQVGLYIAYYRQQDFDRKLITSTNALVTTLNREWQLGFSGSQLMERGNQIPRVRTFELIPTLSSGEQLAAWQWYWVNGRFTDSEIEAKWLTAWSMLTGHGDDSAAIIIYAPKSYAVQALTAFIDDLMPPLQLLLANAHSQ